MLQKSKSIRRAVLMACAVAALTGSALTATHASDSPAIDDVGLPHRMLEDAAAYHRFVTEASAVDAKFTDGNAVRRALKTGSAYESKQLQTGEVAYAALITLQDRRFVDAVRALRDRGQGDQLADRLLNDPNTVMELPGAQAAAANAASVLGAHGQHVFDTGAAVKQSAYTIQHQAWSRGMTSDRPQRLAQMKTLSDTRSVSTAEEMKRLVMIAGDARPAGGNSFGDRAYASPVVTHGVALAALAVLGRARDADARSLEVLTTDTNGDFCLKMAKLNLFQCLAVAGPRYEDVFCLGEHALKETGQCLSKAAYAPAQASVQSARRRSDYQQTNDRYDPAEAQAWQRH
jgi:hypothetical protein